MEDDAEEIVFSDEGISYEDLQSENVEVVLAIVPSNFSMGSLPSSISLSNMTPMELWDFSSYVLFPSTESKKPIPVRPTRKLLLCNPPEVESPVEEESEKSEVIQESIIKEENETSDDVTVTPPAKRRKKNPDNGL